MGAQASMIQNLEWYSVFPLVTGIMAIALGIALLTRKPQIANVNGFFVLMLIFFMAGISDFMMINADNADAALLFARVLLFLLILVFSGYLFISTQLTFIPLGKWFGRYRYAFYTLSVLLGLVVALDLGSVGHNEFGYGPSVVADVLVALGVVILFAGASVSLMARRWFATDDGNIRSECVLLSLAVLMPFVWGSVLLVLRLLDINVPMELSPGFLVSILIMVFSIYRQRLFSVMPVPEDRTTIKGGKEAEVLPLGSYILYEESRPDGMYESLLSQISNGVEGLIVTRTYPHDLREKYGLKRTPVIWLSSQPGQDCVDPTNLSILEHTIIEFLKVGHNTVVAIDGLEYLISNNGTTRVLRLLYGLRDEILMNDSRLMVALDPAVLDIKELAYFERDFKVERK